MRIIRISDILINKAKYLWIILNLIGRKVNENRKYNLPRTLVTAEIMEAIFIKSYYLRTEKGREKKNQLKGLNEWRVNMNS